MKAAVQVLRKAEELKAKVVSGSGAGGAGSGDMLSDNESWNNHQRLQDLYQQLLVIDLEYALDKKVEQDLWNYVFKNQISLLQMQAKDRKNPQRSESQENLVWFLEASSGFYLQLIQELCETFALDISCRRKGSCYGMAREAQQSRSAIAPPHKSSCLYICQHCLVHLGDIARYRNQSLQAETFYRHAAELVPSNGQPYNQLAILEAAKGDKLSTVFYYVRSIAVKYPFPVAATNLQKMFSKIANDEFQHDGKNKLSVYDYVTAFLQFHSLVHLTADLSKAQKLGRVLATNLTILIATESLSAWKLIQMTAINLFAVAHATRGLEPLTAPSAGHHSNGNGNGNAQSPPASSPGTGDKPRDTDTELLSEDEQTAYNLVLELIASMLNGLLLLVYTMKERGELKAYYALPVVKLILDWLRQDLSHLKASSFTSKLQIWPSLCKLLNAVQSKKVSGFDMNKYADVPLPEDWDLQSFVPVERAHRPLRFRDSLPQLSVAEERSLRARRLVTLGRWLCEQQVYGVRLLTATPPDKRSGNSTPLHFEPVSPQTPSGDVLEQLEAVVVVRRSLDNDELPPGQQVVGAPEVDGHSIPEEMVISGAARSAKSGRGAGKVDSAELGVQEGGALYAADKDGGDEGGVGLSGAKDGQGHRTGVRNGGRERKTRQNVALQTIMQKKNMTSSGKTEVSSSVSSGSSSVSSGGASDELYSTLKPKSEGKQVTFKTPSPSPPASSGGTPPLPPPPSAAAAAVVPTAAPSAPSPIFQGDMSCFPPLLQQQQQQQPFANHLHQHPQQQQLHHPPNVGAYAGPLLNVEHNGGPQPLHTALSPNSGPGAAHARIVYANLPNSDHTYQLNNSVAPPNAKFGYYGPANNKNNSASDRSGYVPPPPPPSTNPAVLRLNPAGHQQQQQQLNGVDAGNTGGMNGHNHHQQQQHHHHLHHLQQSRIGGVEHLAPAPGYPPPPSMVFGYAGPLGAKNQTPLGQSNGGLAPNNHLNQKLHLSEQQQQQQQQPPQAHFAVPPPMYQPGGAWFATPPPPPPPGQLANFKAPPNLDQLLAHLSQQQRGHPPPAPTYPVQSPPQQQQQQQQQAGSYTGASRFPLREVNPYVYHLMASNQMNANQMSADHAMPYYGGAALQPSHQQVVQQQQQQQAHVNAAGGRGAIPTLTSGTAVNGLSEVAAGYEGVAPRTGNSPAAASSRPDVHHATHPVQQQQQQLSSEANGAGGVGGGGGGSAGKMSAGTEAGGQTKVVNAEGVTSSYSLFNSPWSSGLNLANVAAKEHENTNHTIPVSKDLGGFLQPSLHSLWSGPGPSPLERLLEQQKQKKDPAPH